jgi:pyruvate,orthophosphate dikinase
MEFDMQIVRIGDGKTEPHSAEKIGAKAANLARMAALGLPVPPAFVLPVELCAAIVRGDHDARRKLSDGLQEGIAFLEQATGRAFSDRRRPLLVSVRSGAARSMPGMLDTVLDVGCTDAAVHGLVRMTGNPRFAWDCRRRFLESYGEVVLGIDAGSFVARRDALRQSGALDSEAIERLAGEFQQVIEEADEKLPDDPAEQLEAAAQAVYRSWMSARACTYRRLQHLDDLQGTAVTVQAMVFGNRSSNSGAGVAFSRDPSTGATRPVIDILFESQGEDVVSGTRTPDNEGVLDACAPAVAAQLRDRLSQLEREFGDVQDVEFTIEDEKLWILQTRSAKRTPLAAVKFAVDFVKEGLIMPAEASRRLDGIDLGSLACRRFADAGEPAACGIAASTGVAVGRAAFDSESAQRLAGHGDPVILMRPDTSTADVAGFAVSAGIVTAAGGRTAHASLVARQMGKPCVVGCAALSIDDDGRHARLGDNDIKDGDWISVDGDAGAVYRGQRDIVVERPQAELAEIARWRADAAA